MNFLQHFNFSILQGKTIQNAVLLKNKNYDDVNCLRLECTDGTEVLIRSSHMGWEEDLNPEYEYLDLITITDTTYEKKVYRDLISPTEELLEKL